MEHIANTTPLQNTRKLPGGIYEENTPGSKIMHQIKRAFPVHSSALVTHRFNVSSGLGSDRSVKPKPGQAEM